MLNLNSCIICGDSITDPVCKDCYIKQTLILLNDLKVNFNIIDFIRDKLKNIFRLENLNETECILCRNDTTSICSYCFSIILKRILRELNFSENLIENFNCSSIYDEIDNKNMLNMKMEVK